MQYMFFKKEDDKRCEKAKKRSNQRLQARTLKWREKLFIHQWISSHIACFNWYLQDENKVTWQWWEVMKMKKMRIFIQLLNTISHAERIIIIINSYILVTSIKLTHKRFYAICIKWTKLFEIENHLQFIQLLHAVETMSFETMYQICSRWLHVKEWMF